MKKLNIFFLTILLFASISALAINCPNGQALVTGFAKNFVTSTRISNAAIKVLETGNLYKTDSNGRFSFCQPISQKITLTINKKGFHEVQSATYVVPSMGFQGLYNEITFQVPDIVTYHIMKFTISGLRRVKLDPKKCTVVTTVTSYHKTLVDDPQGEPNAKITIQNINNPCAVLVNLKPYYFGIFNSGLLKDKTNIFTPNLTETSLDGGVLVYNLNPQTEKRLYTFSAIKVGKKFTSANVWCRAGALINVSPPGSPSVIQ